MVSLLEQVNRDRYRSGVTYMPPVRVQRGPAPRPRGVPESRNPGGSIVDKFMARPDILSNPDFDGPESGGGDGGPGGGLGWVIGKALSGGMKALSTIDYPRAAVTATIRQALETGALEEINQALAKLPGIDYTPIARPEGNEAGWDWDELWRDIKKHEGFGTSIVQPQFEDWNRGTRIALGFAGDIAADPLSYASVGVAAQAGKAERASRLNKLLDAQKAVAERVAQHGGGEIPADLAALQRSLGGTKALDQLGSRGLATANREQLAAMGLERNAIRWGHGANSIRIPGTETIGRGISEGLGALRPVARGVPGAGLIRRAGTRRGGIGQDLLPSFERMLTGSGSQTMEEALRTIATSEMQRVAGGGFEGRANAALRVLSRKAKRMSTNAIDEEVHAAETGADNIWSKFSRDMQVAAKQVGGEIPELEPIVLPDGRTLQHAIPHVLARPFRDYIESNLGTQAVDDFMRSANMVTDDLLEESGFLQKRIFRPNPDGTPAEFKIGEQVLTVEEGTLRELDTKLRAMFPGYDGPIYERDPVQAWRRYIQGAKRDVAKRASFRKAAEKGYIHVDKLEQRPADWDPYGGRETVMIGEGEEAVEAQRVMPNPEAKPKHPQYKMVPDVEATKARNRAIGTMKKGPQLDILNNYETFSGAERRRIAGEVDQLAQDLLRPVAERKAALMERQIAAQSKTTQAAERVEMFDKLRPQVEQALNDLADEQRAVARAIKQVERTADQRLRREQQKLLKSLQERYGQLSEQNERLTAAYNDAIAKIEQRAGAENVVDLPTESQIRKHPRESIAKEKKRLTDRERTNRNARDKARNEYIRGRRAKGTWVEDRQAAQADAVIERAGRSGELQRYREMVERQSQHERSGARAYADALDLDTEINRIDKEVASLQREAGRDVSDEMLRYAERADALDAQVDDLQRQLDEAIQTGDKQRATSLRKQLDHYKYEAKRMRTKLDRATPGEQAERIEELLSDKRRMRAEADRLRAQGERDINESTRLKERINKSRLTEAADIRKRYREGRADLARQTQSQEAQWQNARRELDDFNAAVDEETKRGVAQPAAKPKLARKETTALNKARRFLKSEEVQAYQTAKNRAAQLNEGFIKSAPPRIEIKLRRELKQVTSFLTKNAELGARIDEANKTIRTLEQKLAEMTVSAEGPRRLPFFEKLDREVAEMRGKLETSQRLPKIQKAQEQLMRVPQIEAVRSELGDVTKQLREVGGQTGELAESELLTTRGAMEQTRQLRDQAERAVRQTAEYQGALDRIDNQAGRARETYRMAQNDLDKARAETQVVKDAMEGVNVAPERAATMIEQTKKEAKAYLGRLELVGKGQMPSYEAQPMNRVLNDLEKLIAANPLGEDEAMHKAESVLHSLRGQLSELTEKTDLPARETQQIIKAANNGELAPVLTAQVADSLKLLWDGGDIVVRRDAMKMYLNIREGVQSKPFGRLLTTWTNFFKTYATLSPGFHIRNALTAMFMNWTEGVSTREQFAAMRLWREFRVQDDPIAWLGKLRETDEAAYNAFDAAFASGTGGQFFESGVGEMANARGRIKEGIFANRLTRGSQRFGQEWVEGPQRLALGLHSTRNGGTTIDALNAITRIHFDYSQISDFDEKAKRIIPFWTFTSRNIPLQFTQMWMRPKMYNRYQSLVRNFENESPLPEFTPEYMVNAGAFNTGLTTPDWLPGASGGMPILAQPDLPHLRLQDDIMRMTAPLRGENMGQALSDVNPIFTAPFEYMLGEDFFTGQRYENTDVSQTTKLGAPLGAIASIFGAGRRGANGEWYIDDKAMNLLNTLLPPLERQSRLMPGLLTSGEAGGKNDRLAESYARFWLGAPARTLSDKQMESEARNRYFDALDQAQRLAATGG